MTEQEKLVKLQADIVVAEKKLIALAIQNTDYNAEIARLKEMEAIARASQLSATALLSDLQDKVNQAERNLSSLTDVNTSLDADNRFLRSSLEATEKECRSKLDKLLSNISTKSSELTRIENNIEQLKISNSSLVARDESLRRSISDAEMKIKRLTDKLSSIDADLADKISKYNNTVSELNRELESVQSRLLASKTQLSESESALRDVQNMTADMEKSTKERCASMMKATDEENARLSEREKSVKSSEEAVRLALEQNRNLQSALQDREKELRLKELRIKDLAKKKDIDIEIKSLSESL